MIRKVVFWIVLVVIALAVGIIKVSVVKAWTPVQGHITRDTLWTVADSPYRLIGDVVVDAGVTLTIEPNVRVEVADACSLIVYGSLYAVGTANAIIEFTSSRSDPYSGAWKTIAFCGGESESFVVDFASVSFAQHGITVQSYGKATIKNSVFSKCSESGVRSIGQTNLKIQSNNFTALKYGIFSQGNASGVDILQNNINSNNDGIYAYAYSAIPDAYVYVYELNVQNNQITAAGNGIYVYADAYYAYVYDLTFQSNRITAGGNGIYAYAGGVNYAYVYNLTVQNNQITAGENGIYAYAHGYYTGKYYIYADVYNLNIQSNQIIGGGNGICVYAYTEYNYAYVYNLTVQNNQITAGENGIYAYAHGWYPYVYSLTLQNNRITAKRNGIYVHDADAYYAYVYDLTFQSNRITAGGNGIYAYAYGDYIYVYELNVQNNQITAGGNGTYVCADVYYHYAYVYNLTVQNNKVFSCNNSGLIIEAYYGYVPKFAYDAMVIGNSFSANADAGIKIIGVRTNIANNSVAYNTYGIKYERSTGNSAQNNDIYRNSLYGMHIYGSTVNAEYNYWGNETGPYHPSVNPEGKGDSVYGDATKVDFFPWLSTPVGPINERPVAVLTADKNKVWTDEIVTFDASQSYDDGEIVYYFFDFGDRTNSGWTTLPVVTHKYALNGTYYATVTVKDDYGVNSTNRELIRVQITVVPEFPSFIILPIFMIATLLAVIAYKKRTVKMEGPVQS